MLTHAIDLAYRGFAVFPLSWPLQPGVCSCLRKDCTAIAKHPLMSGWQKVATKSFAEVEALWRRWPEANIGIATGAPSGVIVVDVDGPIGRESIQQKNMQYSARWPTLCARTSRGWHLYYRLTGAALKANNSVGILPKVDLRTTGGYVVAPPSVHASGEVYEWVNKLQIADAPPWIGEPEKKQRVWRPPPSRKFDPEPKFSAGEGGRNAALFRYLCRLASEGVADLRQWAHAANQSRCTPPLAPREVERIAQNASAYLPSGKT